MWFVLSLLQVWGLQKECRKYCHQRAKIILNLQINWKSCRSCYKKTVDRESNTMTMANPRQYNFYTSNTEFPVIYHVRDKQWGCSHSRSQSSSSEPRGAETDLSSDKAWPKTEYPQSNTKKSKISFSLWGIGCTVSIRWNRSIKSQIKKVFHTAFTWKCFYLAASVTNFYAHWLSFVTPGSQLVHSSSWGHSA